MKCSCCEEAAGEAGTLSCSHAFCHTCFQRYVQRTVDELNRSLRCCVCGESTLLTYESKRERVYLRFGRDALPKLCDVTGLATRDNGDYVLVDPAHKRVFTYNQYGQPLAEDFAYTFKYEVQGGIVVDKQSRIIFPILSKDASNPFNKEQHVALAYYNKHGHQRGFTYLDKNSRITSLCVTSGGQVLAADAALNRVWIISPQQRVLRWFNLDQLQGEFESPEPNGVCVDHHDNIYVTDKANHCVKCYTKDEKFRFSFGEFGEQPGQFNQPSGVSVDEHGCIIVADPGNHRVQIFNDEGGFRNYVVRFNQGDDVYLAPLDVLYVENDEVAVLLRGVKDARLTEVRVYSCSGKPSILSC